MEILDKIETGINSSKVYCKSIKTSTTEQLFRCINSSKVYCKLNFFKDRDKIN